MVMARTTSATTISTVVNLCVERNGHEAARLCFSAQIRGFRSVLLSKTAQTRGRARAIMGHVLYHRLSAVSHPVTDDSRRRTEGR